MISLSIGGGDKNLLWQLFLSLSQSVLIPLNKSQLSLESPL